MNKRKVGRGRDSKHVRLYWWLLKSDAYRSLSCHARCALTELLFVHNGWKPPPKTIDGVT
jgi:hypothetical protein